MEGKVRQNNGRVGSHGATHDPMIKDNKLTLEETRTFAKNLYKLSKDELGILLMQSVEKSPAAITRNAPELIECRHNWSHHFCRTNYEYPSVTKILGAIEI